MTFALTLNAPEIEQQQIFAHLQQAHATPEIIVCTSTTHSTNDDAIALYQEGYRSALVISQQQTQGRGQHQRTWFSQQGNIFLSALLELQRPVDGRFALECGLNLIHSPYLSQLNCLQLKWANDLYSPKGKWGGILVEPMTAQHIIVGIGINVIPIPSSIDITQATTSLSELGLGGYQRTQFLAEVYLALLQAVQWFNYDSQNLAQRFNAVAAFKDRWMCLHRQQQADILGYFRGIQNDGAILMQQDSDIFPTVCYDGRLIHAE
ncbi:MAG: biotin--[acetyl-CoA-carboxylase] ligase [Acinetobacter sp.]|jgi:BirA family biotin operon repressor/biotin-[acetyl-CoA-carboxylase] ligase|nr:MAG: biotin--[acetyl-CoA-carboxylase] ligase [Acinetobacter sp.]